MAKRLNKNLVVGLTLTGMTVLTVVAIWMLKTLRDQDPQTYVVQAEEYAADGKHVMSLKAYLRAHRAAGRKDAKYLVWAGDQAMEAEDSDYALRLWSTAMTLDPKNLDAQRNIVQFRLEQARLTRSVSVWAELRGQAQLLLNLEDSSALGHNALGLSLIGLKGQDESFEAKGEEHLRRAVELAPDDADYTNDLAMYYASSERLDEAKAILVRFLEDNPDSARGMMRYAEFLQRYADYYRRQAQNARSRSRNEQAAEFTAEALATSDEAEALLRTALELHPGDAELYIAMGGYWNGQRQFLEMRNAKRPEDQKLTEEQLFERIRTSLERAIELDPDSYLPYMALGDLYRQQNPPALEEALQVYKARYDRPPASRSGFKGMLNRQNQFRLYVQVVETLLEGYVADEPTKKQKKRNDEIIQEAERFLALAVSERTGETSDTYKLRGKIFQRQDKIREAINELEKANAASKRPNVETLLLLADLYRKDGQLGVAYRSVKDALAIRPQFPPAWNLLGQITLALDQPQHALDAAEQVLRIDAQNQHGRWLRAQALVALGREDEVGEDLAMLVRQDDVVKGKLQQAVILQFQGRGDEAIKLVHEALAIEPNNHEAVRLGVLHYEALEKKDEAIAIIDKGLEADPKDRQLMAMKVNLEEEDPEQRDARLIEVIQQGRNPAGVAIQMYNFYVSRRNVEKAREWLDKAEELEPSTPVVIERQYRLALLTKDFPKAEEYVDKAARLNIDGANGEFMRGELLVARGEYQRAVEVLRNAIGAYPSNSDGYVYLAAALQMTGQTADAVEALSTALEYDPTNGRAHLGLAKLAEAEGDTDGLYVHLEGCEKYLPSDPWVREQLQLKLEKEDPQAGIAKREEVRREQPKNVENLVRLADLYADAGRFDDAVRIADEVLEEDPERTWFVSRVYTRAGRASDAESMLKRRIEQADDDLAKAQAQLFLAQHYRALAKSPEQMALAEEAFLQAANYSDNWTIAFQIGRFYHGQAQELNDRDQFLKAAQWYDRAQAKAQQPSDRANVARFIFDALISAREFEEARERIEAYVAEFPAEPRGLLYRGEIALQLGEIPQALQAFDRYLENSPKSAVGYYRRGTVYFVRSEWDQAIDDLSQAKALAPDGFEYNHRKRLATALMRRRDVDAAVAELQSVLAEIKPENRTSEEALSVARLLSEVLGRNGRFEAQRALATQYKNLLPNDPYWHTVLGRNAIDMGNLFQASQYLREACKLSNYDEAPVASAMDAWIRARDYDQVISFVTNEVPEDRRGPSVHLRWAQALAARGEIEEAKTHFVIALDGSARDPELNATVAYGMLLSLGKDGAIEFARERLKSTPDDRTAKMMLASLLGQTPENRSEAMELWKSMAASASSDGERILPLTAGAQLAYRIGEYDTAKIYYEDLIGLYERAYEATKNRLLMVNLPGVLNNLAYMLANDMDQPELALPHIERAANLVSDSPQILDTLGWVQVKLGRYREAIGALSRAVELGVESGRDVAEYHYHVAEAYAREGEDMTSAGNEFQRAYELAVGAGDAATKELIEKRAAELNLTVTPPIEQ
ncbi:MAG: tetratricopeptide repeat protein [Phycisphaerales bacterium]|nr:MAG: tetratricopeptide repeat protein [Phycisphaerales bacterium]